MRLFILVILGCALAACTSATEISQTPGYVKTVSVNRPYQDVFRNVKAYAKECLETGFIPGLQADVRVDADLDQDRKHGGIQVYLAAPKSHVLLVEIDQSGPSSTKLTIKRAREPFSVSIDDGVIASANGIGGACT